MADEYAPLRSIRFLDATKARKRPFDYSSRSVRLRRTLEGRCASKTAGESLK